MKNKKTKEVIESTFTVDEEEEMVELTPVHKKETELQKQEKTRTRY